jgi:hypothetical protein
MASLVATVGLNPGGLEMKRQSDKLGEAIGKEINIISASLHRLANICKTHVDGCPTTNAAYFALGGALAAGFPANCLNVGFILAMGKHIEEKGESDAVT